MTEPTSSRLIALPAELRETIYRMILHPDANRLYHKNEYTSYDYRSALVLFKINRQLYIESRKIFRELNIFVRIETPWPEAQHHVALDGHVPILATGRRAADFKGYHMTVLIDAPGVPYDFSSEAVFLVLLGDLEKFTTSWNYSSLTHTGLNPQLRLGLKLRDPYTPEYEEKKVLKGLQRQLILPFGVIKELHSTNVDGDPKPYPSVVTELLETQAAPRASPETCLREAARLKAQGNAELKQGNYQAALKFYDEAFIAIHVVNKGRVRHIHSDHFFGRELREEPYEGKNGQSERLVLRVQLVANTCLVYNKLEDFETAKFWGSRSIAMLRDAMGVEPNMDVAPEAEAVLGFPAASEMGKIYFRTAVAMKALDEKDDARKLLRVAKVYLPNDKLVAAELASVALRLG